MKLFFFVIFVHFFVLETVLCFKLNFSLSSSNDNFVAPHSLYASFVAPPPCRSSLSSKNCMSTSGLLAHKKNVITPSSKPAKDVSQQSAASSSSLSYSSLPTEPSSSPTSSTPSSSCPPCASTPSSPSSFLCTNLQEMQKRRENVTPEVAQILYEDMLLGRMAEDMCAQQYYRGKVAGFVHLYNGQEAVSTGVIKALRADDIVISTYRDHVHAISKGVPTREVFAELYGKEKGCSKGRGGSMHMFSKKHNVVGGFAYIGEQIPIALGMAFSISYRKNTMKINDEKANQVAVCFMGDGTTNMGQFYEALNMAQLAKLPIIFVVENNNWAIGMAAHRSTSASAIYEKAKVFGIRGMEVDGMDVLTVRTAARDAIDRARSGLGPTVIEALTYRYRGHSLADPDEMRASKEKRAWLSRDPIEIFGDYMIKMNYANSAMLKCMQAKIKKEVNEALKYAEQSEDPKVEELGKYVLTDSYKISEKTDDVLTPEELHQYALALKDEIELKEKRKAGDKTPPVPVQLQTHPLKVID